MNSNGTSIRVDGKLSTALWESPNRTIIVRLISVDNRPEMLICATDSGEFHQIAPGESRMAFKKDRRVKLEATREQIVAIVLPPLLLPELAEANDFIASDLIDTVREYNNGNYSGFDVTLTLQLLESASETITIDQLVELLNMSTNAALDEGDDFAKAQEYFSLAWHAQRKINKKREAERNTKT